MIYHARPFTGVDNVQEKYQQEAELIHKITGETVVCTIPLTNYNLIDVDNVEFEVFNLLAPALISKCRLLVFNGMSKGIKIEIEIANKLNIPVISYDEFTEVCFDAS